MKITSVAAWALFTMVAACGNSSSGTTSGDGGDVGQPSPEAMPPPADSDARSSPVDAGVDADAAMQTDVAAPDAGVADVGGPEAGSVEYDKDGNVAYTTVALHVTNGGSSFTENVYVPGPSAPHPVVSWSPGTLQPGTAYASYAKRLASYGIMVVLRDDPGALVLSDTVAADIGYVVSTWLPAQNADATSPLFGKVDTTHIGLGGHSRGGQATLLAAEALGGKVAAWFGMDPVNTWYLGSVQAITNIASLAIPTAYLGAGVSTNCCPVNNNYQLLYAATPSPSVSITAVGASHTQFEDPGACFGCTVCTPMGTASSPVVLAYSVRYLTAFFARTLLGDQSVGAAFQGAGAPADETAGLVQIVSK